jgi:hypothetical protein
MSGESNLYQFLRQPGFTREELATTLQVLRRLVPCLPVGWDEEYPELPGHILAHLVEGAPLLTDLLEFCLPKPPILTLPYTVIIPDDPRHIDANGFFPDIYWDHVYDAGERVSAAQLLRHVWLPEEIRQMAESAEQAYEAQCAEVKAFFGLSEIAL